MKIKWFVGIDVSKLTLDIVLYNGNKKQSEHIQVDNNEKGFTKIIKWLKQLKCQLNETWITFEHTGIYGLDLCIFLEENNISYSAIAAIEIKRSIGLQRGKNDKIDAFQIARYCKIHSGELKLSKLPSKKIRAIKLLLNERERLVKEQTIDKQIKSEFEQVNSKKTNERLSQRLKLLKQQISEIEKEILSIIKEDKSLKKNFELINSIVGIGLITGAMLLVYTNNFEGFTDARQFACYSGIAPFENSSGTSIRGKTRVSKFANKKLKTGLTMSARSAVINDPELKLYYKRKSEEGKEYGVIMNAIKFKIILRVFAVIKRKTPYVKIRQAG